MVDDGSDVRLLLGSGLTLRNGGNSGTSNMGEDPRYMMVWKEFNVVWRKAGGGKDHNVAADVCFVVGQPLVWPARNLIPRE